MSYWVSVSQQTRIGDKIGDLFVAEIVKRKSISDLINYHNAVEHNRRYAGLTTFMSKHPKDPRPAIQLTGPIDIPKVNECLYARLTGPQLRLF